MSTLRVTRRIAADPTSTALLLAGPAAYDLWPGLTRTEGPTGRPLLHVAVPQPGGGGETTAVSVSALPPRRTPTSFVTRFAFTGIGLAAAAGELVLDYAPAPDRPGTLARLTLDVVPAEERPPLLDPPAANALLQTMAEGFLARLAKQAERRAAAA